MSNSLPAKTPENEKLTIELERLNLVFLDLYTRHKEMVENETLLLTSLYLDKLGRHQLELLVKQTEAARLKMTMHLIQAAINRDEKPNLEAIKHEIDARMQYYYAQIQEQSEAIEHAKDVLSSLISAEESQKLKELFRLLCKRLHPDLNPTQTEEEKDLFIRVKAAYDQQRLDELQTILLYLNSSDDKKSIQISISDKLEQIKHLESQIDSLKLKIDQLLQTFPFTMKELIFNEQLIERKQTELQSQIAAAEEEIAKFTNIISLMTDE